MGKHRAVEEGEEDLGIWTLSCFEENMGGHGTITLRGEIWGRVGRKVGVSEMGISRQKG